MNDTTAANRLQPARFKHRAPAHRRGMLMALALMTTLAGCASHSDDHFIVGGTPPDNHRQRHPIVIDEKEQTLDIPVSRGSYDLPVGSAGAVSGLAARFQKSASGSVSILIPSGAPNSAAARTVANRVADTLRRDGVPGHRIRMLHYDASRHGNSPPLRLSYHAITASVTGCGQWKEDLAVDVSENRQWRNYGCATQSNLASMIANPSDLLGPRGQSQIDAQRRATAIDEYRQNGAGQNLDIPGRRLESAQ